MSLETLWFILIAVLWAMFFFLEGFDFGVGILQLFLGKNERERGTYIASIAPHWDANEVWFITAIGAMFAAFPSWYAVMLSTFYLPFVIVLLALILRGVCFEFRHRANYSHNLRNICDITLALSSFVPALFMGFIMVSLISGIQIDMKGYFTGTLSDLLNPLALLGGVFGLSLFLTHGSLFLSLKIEGELQLRAYRFAKITTTLNALFAIATVLLWKQSFFCIIALVLILAATVLTFKGYLKTSFLLIALYTACLTVALFYYLYPNVIISSVPEYSLTVQNASSSAYTLKIISIITLSFLPVILAYQIWSYYVFRKRISPRNASVEV